MEERENPLSLPSGARLFQLQPLHSQHFSKTRSVPFEFAGRTFFPPPNRQWATSVEGLQRLAALRRIEISGDTVRYIRYFDEFAASPLANVWPDTSTFEERMFVVQTNTKVVERCILMTTDPGDLVLDPTCGSGTTAYVAEQWGRRWITCDTSRVALALARQRLLTATFHYYQLAHPEQGVSAGFVYETVPHITLKSIAQSEPPQQETLYDKPLVDRKKVRVSGPFTVEAIPMPAIEDPASSHISPLEPEARKDDIARRGRVSDPAGDYISTMIDLLKKDGVTFPGGKKLKLENLRPVSSGGFLHAEADTEEAGKKIRVAVSFGPRHGPVTAKQVEEAIRAAQWQHQLIIFAGFAFDPEAQAFIQKNPHPHLKMHLANICPDVELTDLLKTTQGSQLFTVFGQPDVQVKKQKDGTWVVELKGVDLYDPNTGELYSDRGEDVAAWFLDQDYDGRTFCVCQAFFPGGGNDPWEKLSRALKGTIDPEKFEALRGTISQPFQLGKHHRIAMKVIDHRGNEVIRVIELSGKALQS